MTVLRIEHAITDYDTWKSAFDRDPADRKGSGVRRYRIYRPVDDPRFITLDLEFDGVSDAEAMLGRLHGVWGSSSAAMALAGEPQARILDAAEAQEV